MLKVGLTGSIAVGKSFVSGVFRENGCHVLDADQTAREVVRKDSRGLELVVKKFGNEILTDEGELDRKSLGNIVFGNESKRQLLNSILHPLIREKQDKWLAECEEMDPAAIAVVDAALLIETKGYLRFDEIVVVWCEDEIQLERLIKRDSIDQSGAVMKIESQLPQDEKKRFATYLINTSGDFESTRVNTEQVIASLKKKAGKQRIV